MRTSLIVALAVAAAGCGTNSANNAGTATNQGAAGTNMAESNMTVAPGMAAAGGMAMARLQTADGQARGTAEVRGADGGLAVTVNVEGMTPGTYGVHLHQVGRCEGPKFETAGSHWNPTGRQHGRDNPQGAHLGDLPNLEVGGDGRATVAFQVPQAALSGGTNALLDADGAAVVVHARADDYRTDPSGDSGDRIACGVLQAG